MSTGQSSPKPRPHWAEGCGPDFRIVTNGGRYRVQRRTHKTNRNSPNVIPELRHELRGDVWEDVKDFVGCGDDNLSGFEPFETRWLWRAKRRWRRELRAAEEMQLIRQHWSVVTLE